ncbi:MAG: AAA family ATPase [archaeon]
MDEQEYIEYVETEKEKLISKVSSYRNRFIVDTLIDKEINSFQKNRDNLIILYTGLRGIGKSVALYKVLSKYPKSLFIDGSRLRISNLKLVDVIDKYKQINNNKILLIDELNEIPNWGLTLKTIYDLYGLKVIATGSSALKMSLEKNAILRRCKTISIQPLGFREFLKLKYNLDINIKDKLIEILFLNPKNISEKLLKLSMEINQIDNQIYLHFREYVNSGFPFILNNQSLSVEELSDNLIQKIVVDDFKSTTDFSLETITKAKDLIRILANYAPGEVSYEKLSKDLNISLSTVSKILNAFYSSELLIRILNNKSGLYKLRKVPKIYFSSHVIRSGFLDNKNIGAIREDIFVSHMIYNDIKVNYISTKKKSPDFEITFENKKAIVEIGGYGKKTDQLEKGFLIIDDSNYQILDKDVIVLPLFLVCLI